MQNKKENGFGHLVKIVVVLTCICLGIALLLAVVNDITKDRIAENEILEKQNAILAVFPEGDTTAEYTTEEGETVYIVTKEGKIIGYCVNAIGSGYNGDINMMIGLSADHEITGLTIVSMSETPGVGSKVGSGAFLERFIGFDHPVTIGEDVDGISGATFSSKGVAQAVSIAASLKVDLLDAAEKIGAKAEETTPSEPEIEVSAETEPETEAERTLEVPTEAETGETEPAPETVEVPFVGEEELPEPVVLDTDASWTPTVIADVPVFEEAPVDAGLIAEIVEEPIETSAPETETPEANSESEAVVESEGAAPAEAGTTNE